MSGYIYTLFAGADPGHGWIMNDPIFGRTPTLGACVPNIRRAVRVGDYVFAISGRVSGERQFVVGGFRVQEKIATLAAFARFPENRLRRMPDGSTQGNVIVTAKGEKHPADSHKNFERRIDNYLVGCDPVVVESSAEIERAREGTLAILRRVFGKDGNRVFDIIGRQRRMDDRQVGELLEWINSLKR